MYLRYNTGLHISENGRALDALLGALVDAWPVPVQDVVLIGHSMGGLVARSALHQAGGGTAEATAGPTSCATRSPWARRTSGAPLERGVHRLDRAAGPAARRPARWPGCSPCAASASRTCAAARWSRPTGPAATSTRSAPATHTHVPLHDGARHFVVLATLSRNPDGPAGRPARRPAGAAAQRDGDTGDDDRLAFPADHVHRLGGLHHFDLLNHPRVYAQIRRGWGPSRGPAAGRSRGADGHLTRHRVARPA